MASHIDNMRRLIEGLYLKTTSNQIKWTYDADSGTYETKVNDFFIQCASEVDEAGDYYNLIKILNSSKDIIDRINGGTLFPQKPVNTGHSAYWELFRDLREAAERSASGADEIIGDIVKALGIDKIPLINDDVPF